MIGTKIIYYEEIPETVKMRLHGSWHVDLVRRYKEMGFGEPEDFEIERNKDYKIRKSIFIQSDHIFYECEPKRI